MPYFCYTVSVGTIELPESVLKKAQALGVNFLDVEEAFIRGSGKGGQKINKTANCVWLRHRPTGLEVKVQKHREQSKNRLSAYKLLLEKLDERIRGARSARAQKIFKLRKQKQRRSKRAKEKILEGKRHRAMIKADRKPL